jgi:hypothetical protein
MKPLGKHYGTARRRYVVGRPPQATPCSLLLHTYWKEEFSDPSSQAS